MPHLLPLRIRAPRWAVWLTAATASLHAARFALPPIDGQMSGDFVPAALHGAPTVHWQLEVRTENSVRHVVFTAAGEGTRIEMDGDVDAATGQGKWRVAEGTLDAARWLGPALSAAGSLTAGTVLSGKLVITGTGSFAAGVPSGTCDASWENGGLSNPTAGWTATGISLRGGFAFDLGTGTLWSSSPATFTLETIATNRFGARNLSFRARLRDLRTLVLEEARIEIAGGELFAAPCTIPLQPLALTLDLRMSRVGLQDVAALVPSAVAAARGRVDGSVRVHWTSAGGLEIGAGKLTLRADEPAEVRLAPTPGLLTSSLPPKVLQFYPGLAGIEKGEIPIRAQSLDVSFTPQGDAEGRTASVHLTGGPVAPAPPAPVDLQVNVRGPLDLLVKFGTDSRLKFGGR